MHTFNDGTTIPQIGLGTWRFGEHHARAMAEVASLRDALELGYRLIDSAEMYGEGGAEKIVGSAIAAAFSCNQLARDQLTLVSKVYPHHADRTKALAACDASRKRLGVDCIDLYLLHWRGAIPLEQTLEAFLELQRAGYIRHWGVSNFDVSDMEELDQLTARLGVASCPVNQIYYALAERGPEVALLPWQAKKGVVTMAYSPLDQGALASHQALVGLAAEVGISANQLALAYLLHQSAVIPIPKASSRAHLQENLAALAVGLNASLLEQLDGIFPAPTRKTPLAMI